jgi:Fic family protein
MRLDAGFRPIVVQSSLADLLLHENSAAPGVPLEDVEEVSNYIAAMNHGSKLLETLPLCLRLLREVHEVLVTGTRGTHKRPGEFRKTQNWIGGEGQGRLCVYERYVDILNRDPS